jgi:hypothetical protein
VNTRQKYVYLPAALAAGSFLMMMVIVTTTSPIRNISFSIAFFFALLLLMVSGGYLTVYLQNGLVSPRAKYRIFVISLLIVTILMLRSTQSLGWGDILVLAIITVIVFFYTGRRSR